MICQVPILCMQYARKRHAVLAKGDIIPENNLMCLLFEWRVFTHIQRKNAEKNIKILNTTRNPSIPMPNIRIITIFHTELLSYIRHYICNDWHFLQIPTNYYPFGVQYNHQESDELFERPDQTDYRFNSIVEYSLSCLQKIVPHRKPLHPPIMYHCIN